MNSSDFDKLSRRYRRAFGAYLAERSELMLSRAYELGRAALAGGLGVLDMARIHQDTVRHFLRPDSTSKGPRPSLAALEVFFLESLSAFEVTHRGFREANQRLQRLIQTLEERNTDLNRSNSKLAGEVQERERTEQALRRSETHFRELFRQAQLMQENLRELSHRILHVQEEERKRLSRELHDEVGQAMTAIHVNLIVLAQQGDSGERWRQARLRDTQHLLEQTMETVHRFAGELRPAMLDELGLIPALRAYVRGFSARTGVRIRLRSTLAAERLDHDQRTVVFRVTQESLTNVAKHAHARRVAISLRRVSTGIRVEIADDGRSFRLEGNGAQAPKKRLGLLGMQERARLVNGILTVIPAPGQGTTVRLEIPLSPAVVRPARRAAAIAPSAASLRARRRRACVPNAHPPSSKVYGTDQSTPG